MICQVVNFYEKNRPRAVKTIYANTLN